MGYSGKDSKGFTVYKGVRLKALGDASYALYFMVDRKSRKDKENSTITMLISSGYDKFLTQGEEASLFNNAKQYLESDWEPAAASAGIKLHVAQFISRNCRGVCLKQARRRFKCAGAATRLSCRWFWITR